MAHFLTCLFNGKQGGEERKLSEDTRVVIANMKDITVVAVGEEEEEE